MSNGYFTWSTAAPARTKQNSTITAWGTPALAAADRLFMAYVEGNAGSTTNKILFTQCDGQPGLWDTPAYAQDATGIFTAASAPSLAVAGGRIAMVWQQTDNSLAWSTFDPVAGTWSARAAIQSQGAPVQTSAAPALTQVMGDLFLVYSANTQLTYIGLPQGATAWTAPAPLGSGAWWVSPFAPAACSVGDQVLVVWVDNSLGLHSGLYTPRFNSWAGPLYLANAPAGPPALTTISEDHAFLLYQATAMGGQFLAFEESAFDSGQASGLQNWSTIQAVQGGLTTAGAGTQSLAYNGAYPVVVYPAAGGVLYTADGFPVPALMDTSDWMSQACLNQLGGDFAWRTLSQIVMPGSHDAGMYYLSNLASVGVTQDQDFYAQLMGGVRYFDCRVIMAPFPKPDPHAAQTIHFYHNVVCGPSLDDGLASMQTYLQRSGCREVIVLKFRNGFVQASDYANLVSRLTAVLGDWLYINNTGLRLSQITMGEFVSIGKPSVIVLMDTPLYTPGTPGIYQYADAATTCPEEIHGDPTAGDLRVYDCYTNKTDLDAMIADQLAKFRAYNGYSAPPYNTTPTDLYLISWTLTPVIDVKGVAEEANPALWGQLNTIQRNGNPSPNAILGQIPNIIYLDYYETADVANLCWILNQRFTIAGGTLSLFLAGATEIVQVWSNGGQLGVAAYAAEAGYTYVVQGSNPTLGVTYAAQTWLLVEPTPGSSPAALQVGSVDTGVAIALYTLGSSVARGWSGTFSTGTSTLAWLTGNATGSGGQDLIQVWDNSGQVGITVFSANGAGGYDLPFTPATLNQSSAAVQWLAVQTPLNNLTYILQLSQGAGGGLAMTLYSPGSRQSGYFVKWSNTFTNAGYSAITWLAAHMTSPTVTDVVQVWNSAGQLGLTVFSCQEDGTWDISSSTTDMKQTSDAVAWLLADLNGNGITSIVQVWDNGGNAAFNVYSPMPGGGYGYLWTGTFSNVPVQAIEWTTGKEDTGRTTIVQIFENAGKLALNVFEWKGSSAGYQPAGTQTFQNATPWSGPPAAQAAAV